MTNQKNILGCKCNIDTCPLKKISLNIIDEIINTSPISLTQERINCYLKTLFNNFLNDIINNDPIYLVQYRVDYLYSQHNHLITY